MLNINYNPDILSCLANLSSDEVFTPPDIANQMLDLLPEELWSNRHSAFLDPATKSGVFLREIAKRLIKGLEDEIPDMQERVNHIMTKQIFGIGITELTSLLARRSIYCSKHSDGDFSICSKFKDESGNIYFDRIEHVWKRNRCKFCGASEQNYNRDDTLETHAYQFIHNQMPERIKDMKFDVIIGNPPYQLNDRGAKASASPIYHRFVEQAMKLNPSYISMIIPARWYSGGKGLESFRAKMMEDNRVRHLVDYFNASDCFTGIDLSGGVCYFLWDKNNPGDCKVTSVINGNARSETRRNFSDGRDVFVRFNQGISILKKVEKLNLPKFQSLISSRKPFGIPTNAKLNSKKSAKSIYIYGNSDNGYLMSNQIGKGKQLVNKHKIFISYAYGERGSFPYLVLGKPFIGEPQTACTETYLAIGPLNSIKKCENVISYIKTKFFRFLVLLKKNTQHATSNVYDFVPMVDLSKSWDDKMLYSLFRLNKNEIAFVEKMVRAMD